MSAGTKPGGQPKYCICIRFTIGHPAHNGRAGSFSVARQSCATPFWCSMKLLDRSGALLAPALGKIPLLPANVHHGLDSFQWRNTQFRQLKQTQRRSTQRAGKLIAPPCNVLIARARFSFSQPSKAANQTGNVTRR